MDKQKYEKGGSAGSKGSQFQVHLLTVFLLNALRMRLSNWRLSTEDKRAGKFDDVVLEWPEGAVLLQAKHKENKKRITKEQLMMTNPKNDDFSIPKYFVSYQETKFEFPLLRKAVICTNASVNERTLTFLKPQTDPPDNILFCKAGTCTFHTLQDGVLPELKDKIRIYYRHIMGREVDETLITDDNLIDFQKHFQIYFDYPAGTDLENIIEQLLDTTSWRGKASASEIYSKVMDWFQQKDGKFLTDLHVKAMTSDITRDKYWQSLKLYDVHFQTNDLDFEGSIRRYHFIAEGTCLLQEIRIWHALRGVGKNTLYIHPEDNVEDQKQLTEAFTLSNYVILIIVQPSEYAVTQMWDQIEEILNKYKYKKVVLLTARDNKLVQLIQSRDNGFDVTIEPPTFQDLSRETQDMLLKTSNILFQGKAISLEDLLSPGPMQDYRTFLGSEILEKLVRSEQIRVGSEVRVLEEEVERSYIPRNFIKKNEDRHEGNIFDAKDKLILIANSAGTGKTTTLTKLAVLIKQNNPHLWVVKIVLDHYSKFLKDSLRKRKRTIDIMEFLNSQETTKLANQLDKLVFSMNNKVVLMLDGVDEISPDYTSLVESLLVNCSRTPNITKIFVTTRPHLVKALEKKFQVQSFVLEPFSERNQIDFLTSHWIHNLGLADTEKCEDYARALVRKMFSWTKSCFHMDTDFSAIPLQVKMLAEIFQENNRGEEVLDWEGCMEFVNSDRFVPKLPEKIDLTRLYKLFIEKKRDVFIDKLNPSGSVGVEKALMDQFNDSMAFHRTLSLEIIIDDESIIFSCYKEDKKDCTIDALKIGIIQEVDNGLRFVHRTFAEYFFAECLIIELKRRNGNAQFQKFFIDKVLLNGEFRVVCIFFDDLLQECADEVPSDIFRNFQLSYEINLVDSNYARLVHVLAEQGCVAILRFLLKCVDYKVVKSEEVRMEELLRQIPDEGSFGNIFSIFQFFVQTGGMNIKDAVGKTPLDLAARRGHLEMAKYLVGQGANINTTHWKYSTALYEAISGRHLAIVEYLVEQGADILASIRHRDTELYGALCRYHVRIIDYLLNKIVEGGSVERGLDGEYAMIPFAAAYFGRMDILECLIEKGLDVNRSIRNRQSLIFAAAMGDQLAVLKYLAGQGADINKTDISGSTVLHLVSENSSLIDVAKFLVDSGIDVDVKNGYGETALHVAACTGTRTMAELLIESGADVNSTSKSMRHSVLYTAALNNHLTTVELLAQHGADVDVKNIYGNAILHSVAMSGQLEAVKCLVKLGADVTVRDKAGRTALHVALLERQVDIAKYLIECGSMDVNSKDRDGQTTLHFCVSMKTLSGGTDDQMSFHNFASQRLGIVKSLVMRGANVNLTNKRDETVLYLAVLRVALNCSAPSCEQCLLIVKFLIVQGARVDTERSKGDATVRLAKEIQTHARYREESLETILGLPVFRLLDSTLPTSCEYGPLSI